MSNDEKVFNSVLGRVKSVHMKKRVFGHEHKYVGPTSTIMDMNFEARSEIYAIAETLGHVKDFSFHAIVTTYIIDDNYLNSGHESRLMEGHLEERFDRLEDAIRWIISNHPDPEALKEE